MTWPGVNYYAHTAVRSDGSPELETAKWQLLSTHLRGANNRAKSLLRHTPARSTRNARPRTGKPRTSDHAAGGVRWAAERPERKPGVGMRFYAHTAEDGRAGGLRKAIGSCSGIISGQWQTWPKFSHSLWGWKRKRNWRDCCMTSESIRTIFRRISDWKATHPARCAWSGLGPHQERETGKYHCRASRWIRRLGCLGSETLAPVFHHGRAISNPC